MAVEGDQLLRDLLDEGQDSLELAHLGGRHSLLRVWSFTSLSVGDK